MHANSEQWWVVTRLLTDHACHPTPCMHHTMRTHRTCPMYTKAQQSTPEDTKAHHCMQTKTHQSTEVLSAAAPHCALHTCACRPNHNAPKRSRVHQFTHAQTHTIWYCTMRAHRTCPIRSSPPLCTARLCMHTKPQHSTAVLCEAAPHCAMHTCACSTKHRSTKWSSPTLCTAHLCM